MGEITLSTRRSLNGESDDSDQLMHLVYGELSRVAAGMLAREKPGHTFEPAGLVHEAWLRLVNREGRAEFENRAHLVCAAIEAMRWLLIDTARRRLAIRHGGGYERVEFDGIETAVPDIHDSVLALREALERLSIVEAEMAEVVRLRYLVGLSIQETAEALGISDRTVRRHWTSAREWLLVSILHDRQISETSTGPGASEYGFHDAPS